MALYSGQIWWIMGTLWLNQGRQSVWWEGGGEKGAAVEAGSDLWHSNCTVKCAMDMEDAIEK